MTSSSNDTEVIEYVNGNGKSKWQPRRCDGTVLCWAYSFKAWYGPRSYEALCPVMYTCFAHSAPCIRTI